MSLNGNAMHAKSGTYVACHLGFGLFNAIGLEYNFKVGPKQEVCLAGVHNNFQKCSMYYSRL